MIGRGLFVTLEGIEGAGKTTLLDTLDEWFTMKGQTVLRVREPGGTYLGEQLRSLFLDAQEKGYTKVEDDVMLLVAAKRALWRDKIRPALQAGRTVIADRWTDSLFAYQVGGFGGNEQHIRDVLKAHRADEMPNLTLLLDLDPETGIARTKDREGNNAIDAQSIRFFQRVRKVFKDRAASPEHFVRMIPVDASRPLDEVRRRIIAVLDKRAAILLDKPTMA